ncbi:MAG: prepilin-type N-terminal cleavage/methylation domain-containing protein [Bacilli bacterium]|nr:prepilin-type N-terminal cleavage/methylation domain-containing protein [Bacilli bacterium]
MTKKGFTLIELLAVIVILAIIALITTVALRSVIEKAKKGSAEASAIGYIDAVEKAMLLNQVKGENEIPTGELELPLESKYNVSVKGKKPTSGTIVISSNKVESASMCISNYTVEYSNGLAKAIKKCEEEITDASQVEYKDGKSVADALDDLRG